MMDLAFVALGLALLVGGGDQLVRGAVNLSLRLGLSPLVVGLTVVAFGTSAPELLVSVNAVVDHAPGIALGNVIGSNIANVLLVLGIPAIVSTVPCRETDTRRSYTMMLAATAIFIAVAFLGPIRWPHALVLLAGLAVMLVDSFRSSAAEPELEGADPSMAWGRILLALAIGLVALPLGAQLLVSGATEIARAFGVSEAVIGLTLVAVGTSLPELAASVAAALRREAGMALGNVIGSNMFNLLGIIGIAGLVGPLPVPPGMLAFDLWVMLGTSLLIAPFILRGLCITRVWGVALVALYGAYVAILLLASAPG